jgi:hypothetical protein
MPYATPNKEGLRAITVYPLTRVADTSAVVYSTPSLLYLSFVFPAEHCAIPIQNEAKALLVSIINTVLVTITA